MFNTLHQDGKRSIAAVCCLLFNAVIQNVEIMTVFFAVNPLLREIIGSKCCSIFTSYQLVFILQDFPVEWLTILNDSEEYYFLV